MRFKGLDLNLMVALDVLLTERSVSRTAVRLSLSQPAMSAALSRLRNYFGDELLVQVGKKMFLTPYGEGLIPHLQEFLKAADALIQTSSVFDPARSTRKFRIGASDYIVAAVLAPMIGDLTVSCPNLRFDLAHPDQASTTQLQNGALDLLITPPEYLIAEQPTEFLFEERHVIVGWKHHPIFAETITEDEVFSYGHINVSIGGARQPTFADQHLEQMRKPRRIEISTGSFLSVPWLLVGTNRLAMMHERLAQVSMARTPIAYAPLPFAFPIMREMMQHHHARAADDGLRWLRNTLKGRIAKPVVDGSPGSQS